MRTWNTLPAVFLLLVFLDALAGRGSLQKGTQHYAKKRRSELASPTAIHAKMLKNSQNRTALVMVRA